MTKPIGPLCNLDCRYCFYLEKQKLFPANEPFRMSDHTLETYIRQYIEQQDIPEIQFAWQGGEPTLLGLDFFRKVLALQARYACGKTITNALQTNGTLLDDHWAAFLAEHRFLVGLSLDGPARLHDTYRQDKKGRGTFAQVLAGLRLLKKHRVDFNTLTVVHRANARRPLEVYRFLRDIGSGYLQFIPLVERQPNPSAARLGLGLAMPHPQDHEDGRHHPVTEWSVTPGQYGEFLTTIFDEWVRSDIGRTYIQLFDVTLGHWVGQSGGLCYFSEHCGTALAVEHNGDVFSCDHYVYPDHRLGNLHDHPLGDLASSDRQRHFGRQKSATLPAYCRTCDVHHLCRGECPKHRFIRTPDGQPGLNYLCSAYKRFFTHSAPAMRRMANLLRTGRAPAEIMPHHRRPAI